MATTAHTIAAHTIDKFAAQADTWENTPDMDGDTRRRLVATLRTGTAWVKDPRTVIATVTGPDTHIWGYTAGDMLDAASDGFTELDDTAHITQIGPAAWQLTW